MWLMCMCVCLQLVTLEEAEPKGVETAAAIMCDNTLPQPSAEQEASQLGL